MSDLGPLVRAEWRNVTTTKLLWVLAGIAVAYSCVQAALLVLLATGLLEGMGESTDLLNDPAYLATALGQAGTAATFVLILGIIAMTGEFRHMTISTTFLVSPTRWPVLTAKWVLYGLIGAVIGAVTILAVLVTTLVVLIGRDHAPITVAMVMPVLIGGVIGVALYAILGVGLGSLVTNQVAAIVIALVWMLLVEALVSVAFPSVAPWLPGGALDSAMSVGMQADMTGSFTASTPLPPWAGILVVLGYAAVFGVIASRTTLRRDIT